VARKEAAPVVTLAVGPEGGFEEVELEALKAGGFVPVSLGRTILRFETAAVAALSAARAMLDLVEVPMSGAADPNGEE
jgi:16S rRNA (uracil1498-N3)-methyltransferase